MQPMRRSFPRRWSQWHPHVCGTRNGSLVRGGAMSQVAMYGPAGLVGPVGSTDQPYTGMDPSDAVTWVRPYNPQPGMIAYLNFDGAVPNQTQTISGRGRVRR